MSIRKRRRHHYLYVKFGGVIVAIHYGVWAISALAGVGLLAYWHKYNPHLFREAVATILVVVVLAAITLGLVLYRLFRGNRPVRPIQVHEDHSQCAHTLERAREVDSGLA